MYAEDIELYEKLNELMVLRPGYEVKEYEGWKYYNYEKSPHIFLYDFEPPSAYDYVQYIPPLSWLVRELRKHNQETWSLWPELDGVWEDGWKWSIEFDDYIIFSSTPEGACVKALIRILEVK